jgi:ABC-2 type transport system permease protein
LILRQTRWALLTVLRVREAVVFTLAFPIILLALFNTIFDRGAHFTGSMVAYSIASTAFSTLAISLVEQRESGQLKRLRGTPLPPWVFVSAQVLRVVVLATAMIVALLTVGVVAFGVPVDGEALARVALYGALGTATMAVLGIAATAVGRSADTASTLAPFIVVILAFISGVFLPEDVLPDWLEAIGSIFPLAPLADGLQRALTDTGTVQLGNVLALLGWCAVGLLVAVRGFRWTPQAAGA